MNLILYAPSAEICEKIIRLDVENITGELGVELHRSLETLKRRLSHPWKEISVGLFYVVSEEELTGLLQIKEMLWEIPVILVMTLSDKAALKKAHLIRPRFLTDGKSDFKDIINVLNRTIHKNKLFPNIIQDVQESIKARRKLKK
jgi:hypothetical protein